MAKIYFGHNDNNPNCNCKTCSLGRSKFDLDHKKDSLDCKCFACFMGADQPHAFIIHPQMYDEFMGQSLFRGNEASYPLTKPIPLEVRVTKDIESLMAGLDDFAGKEEPGLNKKKPLELDKYEDALEYVKQHCEHENMRDILWNREWACDDCGKHFNRAEYKKIIGKKGWFMF